MSFANSLPQGRKRTINGGMAGTVQVGSDLAGTLELPSPTAGASNSLSGRVLVANSLTGSIFVPAGGLGGQVVLNANASTTPTPWWSGTIKVGSDTVAPSNFAPNFPPPSYTALAAALGGGSISVVPFAIRNLASFPLRSATTDLRQLATQQFVGLGNSIRLDFYGPLATPAP